MFLQTNATIIAGLLILFTIQSISSNSLLDLAYNYEVLNAEEKVLENLQGNITESKKMYDLVDSDGNVILKPNPTENDGEMSFWMPLPLEILEKQEQQINKMRDENFEEKIKLQAKIDIRNKLSALMYFYSNPQFVVSLLIIPFIISMLVELASWGRNITNSVPNAISYGFFILGLALMLGLFVLIFIAHVFAK